MSESAHFGSAFIALNTLGYHFLGSTYDDRTTCLETKIRNAKDIGQPGVFRFDTEEMEWKASWPMKRWSGMPSHCGKPLVYNT